MTSGPIQQLKKYPVWECVWKNREENLGTNAGQGDPDLETPQRVVEPVALCARVMTWRW